MEKIKVIFIAHASHSFHTKGQKTLKQVILDDWFSLTAKQLKKFYPDIEVECWCPERDFKKQQEFSCDNIKYRQFPTTLSPLYALDLSMNMIWELKREIKNSEKAGKKVIIHMHEHHNLHGLVIATLFKNDKIISQHHGGSWPLKHLKQTKRYKLFFPFFLVGQIWEYLVLKNINVYYALSEDEINYLKKVAPKSKIIFQTMGIEEHYFDSLDKRTARKTLGWPLNKKIIIFLGRICNIKGVKYLLDAMEDLKEIELKIIGWDDLEYFKEYANKKNLKNVEFLGPIFGEKKLVCLSAGDCLVLPSSKEGAPVSIMEAMARNLPIVASNVGGIPQMIKNGKNGFIIKPRNSADIVKAVRKIIKNPPKEVRQYAKVYKWKKIINDTVEDYKRI